MIVKSEMMIIDRPNNNEFVCFFLFLDPTSALSLEKLLRKENEFLMNKIRPFSDQKNQ